MSKAQSKSTLPETISLADLRMLLGIATSHINSLERQGILTKTERGSYTLDSIPRYIRWLRGVKDGPADWRAVRTEIGRERLAILRLERGQREGELLLKADMIALGTSIVTNMKNRLLAVPRATAPLLLGLSHPSQAESVTSAAITEALTELAALGNLPQESAARGRRNGSGAKSL
jgi:hypothetical protein